MPETTPSAAVSGEPSVVDDGIYRRLYFGPDYIQSEMSVDDPIALQLAYTRRMMAALLFLPRPKHIVIAGLGGGSLTKFCHHHLPRTRITTLEIDARVIALAGEFQVPADEARSRIVHAEACEWFANTDERFDLVLLDGYTETGIASGFGSPEFYANIRARLRPDGLLIANILVTTEALRRYKRVIAEAFDERMIVQRVVPDGNTVIFAFQALATPPDWVALGREAKKLEARLGLDFPAYARAMRRAYERTPAEAEALAARDEPLNLL
ncbi:fused MFS/spermidine synthase [uncultured Nevskia sp.]|uniref:fused MFS/spermidine synthase n=1 Tax=uncultured Nevskia sp. TaxID=228950 RepID=UPI002600778C|nr:fused MFS/spermidine synthase [uncultured Nevskia sp.]